MTMAVRDHDELMMESLDSPESIAEYLNEAVELGHEEYLEHALIIIRRKAGEVAQHSIAAAAELQRTLAPLHVTLRFEPIGRQASL
ncbi:MAG TPA: hypothetical protein VFX22_08415 [Candidatus Kapabacteria bacterium]|nr:hypothetical protein [Candidatus Kapabacteria bacterium]